MGAAVNNPMTQAAIENQKRRNAGQPVVPYNPIATSGTTPAGPATNPEPRGNETYSTLIASGDSQGMTRKPRTQKQTLIGGA